jgi:hypothetical protein
MTAAEFTLWLHGYLEALETEGIEKIKITNIREKMGEIRNTQNQERVVFGPNVKRAEQQGYLNPDNGRPI